MSKTFMPMLYEIFAGCYEFVNRGFQVRDELHIIHSKPAKPCQVPFQSGVQGKTVS